MFEDPSATAQLNLAELSIGGLYLDEDRKAVWISGRVLDPPLAPKQYSLLELLVQNEGQVVAREQVAAIVWPDQVGITDQMIDALVSRLRKRLEEYNAADHLITRRGFGLMFVRKP
jgi:DNA-binding response OmpR family regulator